MTPNQSRTGESSDDEVCSVPTVVAGETLDLGLISASLASLAVTYGLMLNGVLTSPLTIVGVLIVESFVVFLAVPHVIALWLGYDVDTLLNV